MNSKHIFKKLSVGIASLVLVCPLFLNSSRSINAKVQNPVTTKVGHHIGNTRTYRSKLSRQIDKLAKETSHEYSPGYYPSKSHKKAKRYFKHMKWATNTLFKKENELSKLIYNHLKFDAKHNKRAEMKFLLYDMNELQGKATIFGDRRGIDTHLSKAQNRQLNINNYRKKQQDNQILNERWSKDAKQLKSIKLNLINKSIKHNKGILKKKHVNHTRIHKLLTKEHKSLKSTRRMNVTNMPIRILT